MTKTRARQRAHYKAQLRRWERGEWTPPPGWAQMVCNRFPDLIEAMRDKVLGKEEAERVRAEHIEAKTPQPGTVVNFGGSRALIDRLDPISGQPGKFSIIGAKYTVWNFVRIKLRVFFARLLRRHA